MQLQRGDILGHEWMGIVDEVGSAIKDVKVGDRVVASFQIAYVLFFPLPWSRANKTKLWNMQVLLSRTFLHVRQNQLLLSAREAVW
jgi:hypothetical protein